MVESTLPGGSVDTRVFDPPAVITTDHVEYDKYTVNEYDLGPKVGQGKNGVVYQARSSLNPNRILAIKVVRRDSPQAKRNRKYEQLRRSHIPRHTDPTLGDAIHSAEGKILKEIAIMKKLRHPHVVRLFEVLDDRVIGKIFMVMEYCAGGEVEWTNEGNPVSTVEQTRRIIRDAILGLDYLHAQGIIHRDIKPANLLWTAHRQHVKIADFGTSQFSYALRLSHAGPSAQDDLEDPILLTDTNLAIRAGTPMFMAPEVVYDSVCIDQNPPPPPQPITNAIDVWALGVTLYCLLFGKVPFAPKEGGAGSEWKVYRRIYYDDWEAEEYMGYDRIPTGGRYPTDEHSEGGIVMHLLDHFLAKDVKLRITLSEVRVRPISFHHAFSINHTLTQCSPWFLHDLPNPDTWLQETSQKIIVSPEEERKAISMIHFRWRARIQRGMTKITKRIRAATPDLTSTLTPSHNDRHGKGSNGSASMVRHRSITRHFGSGRDKGKGKATDMSSSPTLFSSNAARKKVKSRSMSTDRSGLRARGSTSISRHSSIRSRSDHDSTTITSTSASRFTFTLPAFLKRSSRNSTPKSLSPDDSDSNQTRSLKFFGPPRPHATRTARASAEALRYHHPSADASDILTADRRVSSWGDHPIEFRNDSFDIEWNDEQSEAVNRYDSSFNSLIFGRSSDSPDSDDRGVGSSNLFQSTSRVIDARPPRNTSFDFEDDDSSSFGDHGNHSSFYGCDVNGEEEDEEDAGIVFSPGRKRVPDHQG
ncbi:other/CAMKK/ELM protein kinase [Desarmillaria tabescens]|uniref:Other/CAMKK/ELM protein kinase n=1 Tax=Armillaria tabescens TaxID=1929756 RepID=A0AA39NPM9_ARMTA|nr:other/CAMKK/ELM protein kinase [Desarmillaria tabescens]KAK0469532.1 other/CAMKK/ELM protein kinase [Desarmillaria tabescens]